MQLPPLGSILRNLGKAGFLAVFHLLVALHNQSFNSTSLYVGKDQ
jgi:hypothetical protein